MRNYRPLIFAILLLVTIGCAAAIATSPRFIYNNTDSVPRGLYFVFHGDVEKGRIAIFPVPDHVASLVKEREWLPDYALLMKPIAALPGDYVCINIGHIFVNGVDFGEVSPNDSLGRPLPSVNYCGVVPSGYAWMLIQGKKDSFDSRYYGAIPVTSINGYAGEIWTY